MLIEREKFATQVDKDVLATIRQIARDEGRQLQVIAEAAAPWESLSQNHPFVDGDKRTAFAAMFAFLAIDGRVPTADADSAWVFMPALYEKRAVPVCPARRMVAAELRSCGLTGANVGNVLVIAAIAKLPGPAPR